MEQQDPAWIVKRRKPGPKAIPEEELMEMLVRIEAGEGPYAVAQAMGYDGRLAMRQLRNDPERSRRYWLAHQAGADEARNEADQLTAGLLAAAHARAAWEANPVGPQPVDTDKLIEPVKVRHNHLIWEASRRDPARFGVKPETLVSVSVSQGPDMSKLTTEQLEALAAINSVP
jgi:hypothetical protein